MPVSPARTHSILLHAVDSPDAIDRAIGTATTLRKAFPETRIRIIVNGDALLGAATARTETLEEGISIGACRVGLQKRNIDEKSLAPNVEVVPSASVTLVQEQFDGAAYIRI